MIGAFIDSAIGLVSPKWAYERSKYRSGFHQVRGYDAAVQNRTKANWFTKNTSADRELRGQADIARNRSRDLVRNNAYARNTVDATVANVVGCGIVPMFDVKDDAGEPIERINKELDKAFARWIREADVAGRLTFFEIQSLVMREVFEAGEVLVHFVESQDESRLLPFALEIVDSDRLDSSRDTLGRPLKNGNTIRRGVELNPEGKPVGYWVFPGHPNDIDTSSVVSEMIPASRMLHLFRQERAGQTRGITQLAPVVSWLRDMGYYFENELQSSAVASCYGVVIKSMGDSGPLIAPSGDDTIDSDGNTLEYIQPGMVTHLQPGEDISIINPTRQNSASEAWNDLIVRSIAVGTGNSFEVVSRDYSKTNFSSNRASDLESRRRYRPWQKFLVNHLCLAVAYEFVRAGAMKKLEGFPSAAALLNDRERWSHAQWLTPGWEWVDPVDEEQAAEKAIAAGLSTRAIEIAAKGGDWREVFRQLAREQDFQEELNLKLGTDEPEQAPESAAPDTRPTGAKAKEKAKPNPKKDKAPA